MARGIFALTLWVAVPASGWAAPPPATSLRADNGVQVLATAADPFLVPLYLQHGGSASVVHIGLDYDEFLLRYNDSWSLKGALGRAPWAVIDDPEEGYLEILIPFDPRAGGRESEALLIQLEFTLAELSEPPYAPHAKARIHISDADTYFLQGGERVPVGSTVDGGVVIYFHDALELGSARLTPDRQEFHIPVYVTHLVPETAPFSMGLDYDEFFLQLLRVDPVSPLLAESGLSFDEKLDSSRKAWVQASFREGVYPQLLRRHLLDLVFEYRSEAGVPAGEVLELWPIPVRPLAAAEGGTRQVEVREGILYVIPPRYVRGDADRSDGLAMNDALAILGYVSGFGLQALAANPAPPCLDAMDADADGQVNVSDGIYVLNYLFLGGSPPPLPFPEAGPSPPGSRSLGCPDASPHWEPLPLSEL